MKKSLLPYILPLLAAVSITACGSRQSKNFAVSENMVAETTAAAMESYPQSDYGNRPNSKPGTVLMLARFRANQVP